MYWKAQMIVNEQHELLPARDSRVLAFEEWMKSEEGKNAIYWAVQQPSRIKDALFISFMKGIEHGDERTLNQVNAFQVKQLFEKKKQNSLLFTIGLAVTLIIVYSLLFQIFAFIFSKG